MEVNTICLDTAVAWTTAWRSEDGTFTDHKDLKAFLIPLDDLKEVIAEPNVVNVRAYIGVDASNDNEPHLIIVGVNEDGQDIIYKAASTDCNDKNGTVSAGTNTGLYDFSQPCPTTCDVNSPLFGKK